jgi:hypothetical protein
MNGSNRWSVAPDTRKKLAQELAGGGLACIDTLPNVG